MVAPATAAAPVAAVRRVGRNQWGALDANTAHFVGLPRTTKGRSPQGPALAQAPSDPQLQPLVCSSWSNAAWSRGSSRGKRGESTSCIASGGAGVSVAGTGPRIVTTGSPLG